MPTASELIVESLINIGEKTIGGTLDSGEQTHYLRKLNAMLESWSNERLLVYQLLQESLALTTSVGSYTIGSGGAFNTTRPIKIVDPCFIRDSSSNDYALELINAQQYGAITNKTSDGTIPQYLFYDAAFASSLATIYLWPEPSASLTLYINSWKQLQQFSLISTSMVLPPGYQRAIVYNFSIECAPGLTSVSPETIKIARESKAAIQRVNAPAGVLGMPPGMPGSMGTRFNIMTGT